MRAWWIDCRAVLRPGWPWRLALVDRRSIGSASRVLLGAIAQLGERLLCKQEVVGSIPSGSTIRSRIGRWSGGLSLCDR
jgi:hypothetical protein